MQFRQVREKSLGRVLACALVTVIAFLATVAPVGAVVVTDNFNADFNYALGAVGGIWNGSENMLNSNGGLFNANISNPGVLTVEDNGTFVAPTGPAGVGWEGNRSTAPFLSRNVPAGQDFTATVKISAQTSGQWSAAGLIARAANSATPPGVGADNADENYVTMTTFRTDAANANAGNTLMKRIEAGAQVADLNTQVNADPAPEPLPLVVRLQRFGGVGYVGSVSTDGGTTFQYQSMTIPAAGNALRDSTVGTQVGLSYMNFGTLAGTTQFDDFSLDTHAPQAAPGAPTLTTTQPLVIVPQGGVSTQLVTASAGQGALLWARAPNLAGTDAMIPTMGGPASTLVPVPPPNGSYFRWAVPATQAGGDYVVNVTATNAWGEVSQPLAITIRVIPEPASMALVGLGLTALVGLIRRKR
jgi:hypothetical protein